MEKAVAGRGGEGPEKIQLQRAFRLLNKSLESFYQRRYEQVVELCGEALGHLLPVGTPHTTSPEEKAELFLRTYASALPAGDAEGIAGVFTFFQSRRARFRFRQGAPLPQRDWWQFVSIGREEAEGVLHCTRLALNTLSVSREG